MRLCKNGYILFFAHWNAYVRCSLPLRWYAIFFNQDRAKMVLSWLCLQARARWMFAYHIPNGATCHTRENVSYHLCCAAKWYKQKRLCGSVVPAWLYFCWAHFTLWASYPRCHMQKYARHGGRQPLLWGLYGYLMVSFLVSTLYASDPKCRMQKHARNLPHKRWYVKMI